MYEFEQSYVHRMDALHGSGRTPADLRYKKETRVITKKFREYANKWFYQDAAQKRTDANNDVNRLVQFYIGISGIAHGGSGVPQDQVLRLCHRFECAHLNAYIVDRAALKAVDQTR